MKQKVNIDSLANAFAEDFPVKVSKKDAKLAIQRMFQLVAEEMQAGGEVNIPDFGKFFVRDTPARTGRNPATGESIEIPAKKAIKFSPAKGLKERLA